MRTLKIVVLIVFLFCSLTAEADIFYGSFVDFPMTFGAVLGPSFLPNVNLKIQIERTGVLQDIADTSVSLGWPSAEVGLTFGGFFPGFPYVAAELDLYGGSLSIKKNDLTEFNFVYWGPGLTPTFEGVEGAMYCYNSSLSLLLQIPGAQVRPYAGAGVLLSVGVPLTNISVNYSVVTSSGTQYLIFERTMGGSAVSLGWLFKVGIDLLIWGNSGLFVEYRQDFVNYEFRQKREGFYDIVVLNMNTAHLVLGARVFVRG